MSYYKYLYSGKQKSTTTGSDENTITHIILALLLFYLLLEYCFMRTVNQKVKHPQ